ncbi:glycosyltransferase family 4 protein [Streptomyces sp. 135]|uniref:glycosyltransferase family 4 protein n=1 Tax=Streptomyces sp. 135 TaxID=2838850 RepID=UPI001CBEE066|nr:glycosyltransferase family 4 protein [Streptomyces sp. 135]
MKISFLLHNRYGIGGVIQSTLNLAGVLADRHEVEIVSTRVDRDRAALPLDDRVRVVDLVDTRKTSYGYDGQHALYGQPPELFPAGDEARASEISRLTEVRLGRYLAKTDADVVIATNPGIAVCLAAMGSRNYVRVAQEHQALAAADSPLGQRLLEAYRQIDAVVTVNAEDARRARLRFGYAGTRIESIPNCVPPTSLAPSDLSSKTVVAAGRLAPVKRFDDLVAAFDRVVQAHPDWQLRIFGVGNERGRIMDEVVSRGLENNIFLMGSTSRMELEWAKAALAVSSSKAEAFSLVVVEAGRAGVPCVSTACDGPRGIIQHGVDGLLTPVGDVDSLATGMLTLIEDDARRGDMGAAALQMAARYLPENVAAAYEELLLVLRADQQLPSHADWWTDPDGDVHVRVEAGELAASALRLLCVSGDGLAAEEQISVGFTDVGFTSESRSIQAQLSRAALPLTEGMWELYVSTADGGARRRLHTGVCDDRSLLSIAPTPPGRFAPAFVSVIPYTGQDDTFNVRVWVRERHAEVLSVDTSSHTGALIKAELWGEIPTEQATVMARSRENPALDVQLDMGPVWGREISFTLPYAEFATRHTSAHDIWDLFVCAPGINSVRLGGFTGDCIDRKKVYRYPAWIAEHTRRGRARIRPYYTVDNELSVNAVDLPRVEETHGRRTGLFRRNREKAAPEFDPAAVVGQFEESPEELPREELVELCRVRQARVEALEKKLLEAHELLEQGSRQLSRLGGRIAQEVGTDDA